MKLVYFCHAFQCLSVNQVTLSSASLVSGSVLTIAKFFSQRELTMCHRPSVCLSVVCVSVICRLSVTFVRPTQAIEIFGNVSTPFGTLAIC